MSNSDLTDLLLTHLRKSLFLTFEKQAGLPLKITDSSDFVPGVTAGLDARDVNFSGHLQLSFTRDSFLSIANHMLGEHENQIGKNNESLAAELLNLIYASARTAINEAGYRFQPAIPFLMSSFNPAVIGISHPIRIHCESSMGPIRLDIRLEETK